MIYIRKNEWVNPETIESMELYESGLQLFMVSGRVVQIIDNVGEIMRDIEEYFKIKMGSVPEPKPKRKYTKKKKVESADGDNYYKKDDDVETL